MNLKILLILICSIHLSAAVHSQNERLSLKMEGVSLEELIWELQKRTDFVFMYGTKEIEEVKNLSVDVTSESVNEILGKYLRNTGLEYEISGNAVIIKRQQSQQSNTITVRGTVKDAKGDLLPGATIVVKGTSAGVATGMNGQYVLETPRRDNLTLIFSFIGMETKEILWNGQEVLDVVLEEEISQMNEVVVTGYQNLQRRDMVGAVTTVRADDIMMPAYNSIDQMLQGQVAGLMMLNTSSRVGSSPKIRIRGTSTLLGNQSPLWVVDGIIQEDPLNIDVASLMTQDLDEIIGSQISWLNPRDIETINVLKDASATAIYGSKASNGVIVITTKKGVADRMTIGYSNNISINTRPNYGMFNYMNSKDRIQLSEEAYAAGAYYQKIPIAQLNTYEGVLKMYLDGDLSQDEYFERKAYLETINTDWFKILTQTAVSHNHNLSVSGGTEKITYNASIGYNNSLGQEKGNSSERMTGRINLNIKLHDKLRANFTMNGTSGKNKGFGPNVNPMSYATSTSRAIPAFDEKGERVFYRLVSNYNFNNNEDLGYNFQNERDNSGSQVENTRLSANLDFSWDIKDWLTYQFTGGYTRDNRNSQSYRTEKTYGIANNYRGYDYGTIDPSDPEFKAALLPFGGQLFTSDAINTSYNIQNKILFSKTFNPDSRFNAMLAMEIRSNKVQNNSNTVWGYLPERGEIIVRPTSPDDFVSMTTSTISGLGILDYLYRSNWSKTNKTDNYVSFFGTIAYSYKNRYTINTNFRNDASNRFGQDQNKKFDPTISLGFAWIMTEEPFMTPLISYINNLRFRITYGTQGNVLTTQSPDLILGNNSGVANMYNEYYSTIISLPNPNLSWERTHNWDLGIDLSLFNMFDVVFDYYHRKSNAIVEQNLTEEYGFAKMNLNGGIIFNQGLEFTVSFTPLRTKDWTLNLSLNSSKNWNKSGKSDYIPTLDDFLTGRSDKVVKKGYAVNSFWSFSFKELSGEDGRPLFNLIDLPEDTNIDKTSFLVHTGNNEPDFTGGLSLGLRYKSFNLSSSFILLLGSKTRLPSLFSAFPYYSMMPEPTVNLSKDLNKRWKKPGDEKYTKIPGLVTTALSTEKLPDGSTHQWMQMWEQSDARTVNSSFFRCRQLTITWNMKEELCSKIGVKSFSANANVNNVFVIASKKFNGFDPELGNSVMPKQYSFGINIGF